MAGSITEIKPGVYRLRVYVGRNAITGTTKFTNQTFRGGKRAAERELAKMVTALESGQVTPATMTVSELLDRWLEHSERMDRSPTTLRVYKQIASKTVRPALGNIKLAKLTPGDLDRLYASLSARGLKGTSVRRVHALISAALRQAERWGLVGNNVARRASPPPIRPVPIQPPSIEQVRAIVDAAEARDPILAPILLLAALTGARRGELCALRWTDVDFLRGTLTISRTIYETTGGGWGEKPTKTHQHRSVALDDLAVAVLRQRRAEIETLNEVVNLGAPLDEDSFVFSRQAHSREPIRPDVLTKFTVRVAKDAGVDTHLHMLRHFSATQLISAGYDPVTVAARLGHRDASITMNVYSHALQSRDREAAASLGRALTP